MSQIEDSAAGNRTGCMADSFAAQMVDSARPMYAEPTACSCPCPWVYNWGWEEKGREWEAAARLQARKPGEYTGWTKGGLCDSWAQEPAESAKRH